jgi:hypothetical protein
MSLSKDELAAIVAVTGRFENASRPYEGVSGDFDGQGISCGVLQWNIGQSSLQPLVIKAGEASVLDRMPSFGVEMWQACNSATQDGLAIVRSWQVGAKLKPEPLAELKAFMGSPEMRAIQDARIAGTAASAELLADGWVRDHGVARGRTLQEIAFFFDLVTQNGGTKGVAFADVQHFITVNAANSVGVVCNWIMDQPSNVAGIGDAKNNATLWPAAVADAELELFVFAFLRCQKSKPQWRIDTLNRKATLAARKGYVHKKLYDFSDILH